MGSCLSKKGSSTALTTTTTSASANLAVSTPPSDPNNCGVAQVEKKTIDTEESVKKEIFVIKHRKSHDSRPQDKIFVGNPDGLTCTSEPPPQNPNNPNNNTTTATTNTNANCGNNVVLKGGGSGGLIDTAAPVRTSSCSKEDLDAILIQCGRLSRSSSGKATSGSCGGRKYSGSKRSYDFDHRDNDEEKRDNSIEHDKDYDNNEDEMVLEKRCHRQRDRQSRSASHGRRRTPSREREQQQTQRSGSRERGSSGSGRRVSRSPGRRSESPVVTTTAAANGNGNNSVSSGNTSRPGKMVSVPATVSSLVVDKSNNVGPGCGGGGAEHTTNAGIRRVTVRRNVGDGNVGSRGSASPRSQSPAKGNYGNGRGLSENQNVQGHQQPSLSRSSSRKAEQSPYRRNPLGEIDTNSLAFQQPLQQTFNKANNNVVSQASMQKPNVEDFSNSKVAVQGTNKKSNTRGTQENKVVTVNCRTKEQQQIVDEPIEPKGLQPKTGHVEAATVASGAESLKPQTPTRSRSSRRSRDLDLNPETLLNPPASYTTLLLEDIQNFHQKNNTAPFSFPACVTKACSILEAVADLNSCTSSNLSCAFSEDQKCPPLDQSKKNNNDLNYAKNLTGKKGLEPKDPFMESELSVGDDLMEPSLHKYVTVRRGTIGGGEMDEQESSGSNSVLGSQQHWGSPWEPNSADSTDCWTSRSNTREEDPSPQGDQRHALSELGREADEGRRRFKAKRRDSDHLQTGIGRGRVGTSRGLNTLPTVAATAST